MTRRILIADDNASVRTALRQLLQGPEYIEFIEVQNGEEAVVKALDLRPDVVILDLAMPVMDGMSAARQILRALPDTPVFLCTMHCSRHLEVDAAAIGVRNVVSKAQSKILIEAVQQLLTQRPQNSTVPPSAPPLVEIPGPVLGPAVIDPAAPPSPPIAGAASSDPAPPPPLRRSG
jgi:DNA-binding NarL/FixJ family response regulator